MQLMWFFSYKKQNEKINFNKNEVIKYFKIGFVPALETLIRNFFYITVTLNIVNSLGETEWNSWNLANLIYWNILFKFANITQYALISEQINNKEINSKKLTYLFIFIDFIFYVTLSPIIIIFVLPIIVNEQNSEWLNLTIKTAWIMMPFIFLIMTSNKLKTKFIVERKFKLILINTIIINTIIYLPIYILILCGKVFTYDENLIIWISGITLSFIIYLIQYEKYK